MKLIVNGLIIVLVFLLTIPLILQYIYDWNVLFIVSEHKYSISVYGFYIFTYMVLQFILSFVNNKNEIWKMDRRSGIVLKSTNVLMVGHREDVIYYRNCLESIKTSVINTLNVNKVYIVIDGDETEDEYMVEECMKIFNGSNLRSVCIRLPKSINSDDYLTTNCMGVVKDADIICISQPHSGKRNAMMTGFKISQLENILHDRCIGSIFCTDSDTVIHEDAILRMLENLNTNKNVSAVTGNLGIYNKYDSIITFMSSMRYWYAFNLERGYQSFSGNVLCVSGPIGIYNLDDLGKVIDDWGSQVFLGKSCTYGDDRHLTNKILGLGKKVIYVESAYAETETPVNIYRFFKQQVRWNKSSFRELFWSIGYLNKHSMLMAVDLTYTFVYPYVVVGYLLYVLWVGSVIDLGNYIVTVFVLGLLKSVYGSIYSRNYENLFYVVYILLYITIICPSRLWAICTINDNSWGTSSRKILNTEYSLDILVIIIWNMLLIGGFISNIYRSNSTMNEYLYLIVSMIIWVVIFIMMFVYIKLKGLNIKRNGGVGEIKTE